MGYENGKTYWIVPRYNTNVALSVYGNTQVSQNRNVVVWDKQEIADQLWRIDVSNGYARIKSEINNNYALNILLGSDKYGNCDIHTWSDNTNDSKINFKTIDASQNLYLIQCYRNEADNNLYLTAESTKSGSNVKWAVRDVRADQVWKLIEKRNTGAGANTIPMSVNVNQKYRSNSEWIKNWGCAVCCGVDLASWLNKKTYTIDDFKDYYYEDWRDYEKWRGPDGFSLQTCVSLSAASEAETIETIRSYVRNGTPVACHAKGSGKNQHWFVAYEVTGENGSTWATAGINVLDPYEKTDSSYEGRQVPILTAMQDSYSALGVIEIRIPSKE